MHDKDLHAQFMTQGPYLSRGLAQLVYVALSRVIQVLVITVELLPSIRFEVWEPDLNLREAGVVDGS